VRAALTATDEPWPFTEDTADLEDAWLPVLSGSAPAADAARPATSAASGSDPVSTSARSSPRTSRHPRLVTASEASCLLSF
jgi:hypothetical protein